MLRHAASRGPAAARNTGLAACDTDFVAFLDSDVVPRRGWLEALLGHFCDPAVALVAPRIVGLREPGNLIARYEAVRSSLDLGLREAPIVPYGTVSYAPSAAIICRRSALQQVGGFDESLTSGEDVDLCWRFIEAEARLRYEPIALVGHDHRTKLRDWFVRKAFYGSSAAPLAIRHPGKTAPLVLSGWTMLVWVLLAMGSSVGFVASTVVAVITGRKIAKALDTVDTEPREVAAVAAQGLWSAALQLASAICRHYWPVALVAAVLSRRCRQVVLVAAVVDGVVDWVGRNGNADDDGKRVGLLGYLLLKRLDDIAYGFGLWRASCASVTSARSSHRSGRSRRLALRRPDRRCRQRGCVLAESLSRDPHCRVTLARSGSRTVGPGRRRPDRQRHRAADRAGELGGPAL